MGANGKGATVTQVALPTPKDELFARFYDLEYRDYADDLDFYLGYANALDPNRNLPILDLGCGTGRIALALASAGFNVTGIDSSAAMIALSRQRAVERGLSGRASFLCADMRDLRELSGGPFN